jgi:hypothetical protein
MRRGNKPEIILDGTKVVGVNLSADFCAEHEWGIKRLKEDFGIPTDIGVYGMRRRQITRVPKTLSWVKYTREGQRVEGFMFASFIYGDINNMAAENRELTIYKPFRSNETPAIAAAWSENGFAVVSNDQAQIAQLKEIFDEFSKLNIAIMLSGRNNPFENSGLVIAIADRIPLVHVKEWAVADEDNHKTQKEFAETGIEKLLSNAGKRYFALSPRRQKDGSLRYWLNPQDQQDNNFGWFTLEDLKLWTVGKGPIPGRKR